MVDSEGSDVSEVNSNAPVGSEMVPTACSGVVQDWQERRRRVQGHLQRVQAEQQAHIELQEQQQEEQL